jgi:protein tyrosine/serine phosphatase
MTKGLELENFFTAMGSSSRCRLLLYFLHLCIPSLRAYPATCHVVGTRCSLARTTNLGCTRTSLPVDSKDGNIPMESIVNMRDIATKLPGLVKSVRLFRTGVLSKASVSDRKALVEDFGVKSLIDLRSEAEHSEDIGLNGHMYEGFENWVYDVRSGEYKIDKTGDGTGKKRYFISLMDEELCKKAVFRSLRKYLRIKAVFWLLLSKVSRRADAKMKSVFVDHINEGGLTLLNRLVLENSGKEIAEVMKIIACEENQPAAIYCTAGKDRTGIIAMAVLSILGASDEEIVDDYIMSDTAYKGLNDSNAMVVSLKQIDVDPETFLRAKPHVIKETMEYLRENYQSIDHYLDLHGFDESWRQKLRKSMSI